jgi:GST-like protein
VNIGRGEQFNPDFLAIAPNNRMPALTDPEGPDGRPISMFESAAIMMYLGRKFGGFYPVDDERKRVEVEQWLMWQMGGFGPMLGQAHHFRRFAKEEVPYAIERYTNETRRLYGVLDKRLNEAEYLAGADYSIADIATYPWAARHEWHGIALEDFPAVKRWYDTIGARPAVEKGMAVPG